MNAIRSGLVLKDRYVLTELLGRNAGRQTWQATDRQTEESVIVKLLTFGGDVQWDDLKLFEREAQVLQQLNHLRIPQYLDYFALDDRTLWFGLVQAYIPGETLKQGMDRGAKWLVADLVRFAKEILDILIYLHELQPPLLHRDIKPSNLILGTDNCLYLVDFGSVQDKAAAEGKTFTVTGTYGYAPIEQFGGRAVPASDLYGLGATLIHLATGRSPVDLPQDDRGRIAFREATSLPNHLATWLEVMTDPLAKKRYPSARAALAALEDLSTAARAVQPRKTSVVPGFATRIQVTAAEDVLAIAIPAKLRGLQINLDPNMAVAAICVLLLLGLFTLSPALLRYMPFLVVVPIALIFVVDAGANGFTDEKATFNRQVFRIERNFLGVFRIVQTGVTRDIQYVVGSSTGQNKNGTPLGIQVVMQTPDRRYYLGRRSFMGSTLSEREAAWLMRILQDWLALES
ncbi:MAG TPA: serine/threonine protein kinase [Cyanobacteria bacterium UBA8156]|jgi:serine/threonine protein kinase|nr:serine/threonine protein kinase [Cyanobacteria bacterium UBA8156]